MAKDLTDEVFRAAVNRNKAYILEMFGVKDYLAELEKPTEDDEDGDPGSRDY